MKQQELIRKVENQVKIFKSRAAIGHVDDKRHDLAKLDERKFMWTVWKQLGWSYRKIGGVFDRDWRTVKRIIETLEKQGTTEVQKVMKPETYQALPDNIDILNSQGKYSEEWKHYNEIKEAIIKLQYVSDRQIGELLDVIEKERVTLDDSDLQEDLDEFIEAIKEGVDLGLNIPHSLITPIISRSNKRMNKRYKRIK